MEDLDPAVRQDVDGRFVDLLDFVVRKDSQRAELHILLLTHQYCFYRTDKRDRGRLRFRPSIISQSR